jgi:hypothetical protein
MTESNPLFDGTLRVKIGGFEVAAALLSGLTYTNTNPGGFGDCTLRLPATAPWGPYNAAVVKGAAVTVKHGTPGAAYSLFEGEVTNDVSHAVVEGGTAYYDITCAGLWWKAGQRKDFCLVETDDDPGQWFVLGNGSPVVSADLDGKVELRLENGQSIGANKAGRVYYWLNSGFGDPAEFVSLMLARIAWDTATATPGDWSWLMETAPNPWGPWTAIGQELDTSNAGGRAYVMPSFRSDSRCLRLSMYPQTAVHDQGSDVYVTIEKFCILTTENNFEISSITKTSPTVVTTTTPHGLKAGDRIFVGPTNAVPDISGWRSVATVPTATTFTMTGVNVTTTAGTHGYVYEARRLDQFMANIAVTTGLATSSSLQAGGVGPLNWSLNVRPHMSRAEALDMLAATWENPLDYGFWDGATFYCKERIAPSGDRDILIDSSQPAIDFNVFKATEDAPTVVKVLYKFRDVDGGTSVYPDGTLLAVYRESGGTFTGDWTDASYVLDVWDEWSDLSLETGQAEALADQILAWLDQNAYQGTITIAAPTVPLRGGGTKNTAYIRAGDYIEDSNLATGPLMVTSMSMDPDSGTATLGIGDNRRDFVRRVTARYNPALARPHGHSGANAKPPTGRH